MTKDLPTFGAKLKQLRKAAGLTQSALVDQLDMLHASHLNIDRELSGITQQLISNWERAYSYKGRQWTPKRQQLICLIEVFADQLTLQEAQAWALQAGYELGKCNLQTIFPLDLDWPPAQAPQLPHGHIRRKHLETLVLNQILDQEALAVVFWGPGGSGKTILATWMAQLMIDRFPNGVIWFENQPGRTVQDILNYIAESLGIVSSESSLAELSRRVHSRLQKKRCLVVLDDVVYSPDLLHLRLGCQTSRLICTSRDEKVSHLLEAALIRVEGLTREEGLALLRKWNNCNDQAEELVKTLGGLPLALVLSGAQLRAGCSLDDLLTALGTTRGNLDVFEMDDPQTGAESLTICFDLTHRQLSVTTRERFAQLGCFVRHTIEETAITSVWGVNLREAHQTLKQLIRFAFIERSGSNYRLHPLLHDYAYRKLMSLQVDKSTISQRYAAWHIRYALYHPGVLDNDDGVAPNLDHTWADTISGVTWCTHSQPKMVAQALLLAHTERSALLEEVGNELVEAVEGYLSDVTDQFEQAILHELLGDLHLLQGNLEQGIIRFENAGDLWQTTGKYLSASQVKLRIAGAHLLCQDRDTALKLVHQAQDFLRSNLPISDDQLDEGRGLFYWFNMVYNPLIRWEHLPEAEVAAFADLAAQTEQPHLKATGLRIYSLWCSTRAVPRSEEIRQKGRQLALEAYRLWRACGRRDQADDEVSFTKYNLTNRYSRWTAIRYARRKSEATPNVDEAQLRLIKAEGIRWWLNATETQRIDWLGWMLPRYLEADNRPPHPVKNTPLPLLSPGSRAAEWVEEILNIGMLGGEGRRLVTRPHPPSGHILNGPEWRVLSGQKAISFEETKAKRLVEHYLSTLEERLK